MRLGLLTDIHEDVRWLEPALAWFRREQVEQVVFAGDVCSSGEGLDATVELLRPLNVLGVWGNHDFGLCYQPGPAVRARYSATVLDFMATLRPRLEIEDCLFTHVEPWLDPTDLAQLWYIEGPPDTRAKIARSLDACPQRVLFSGHLHRWLIGTRGGILDWDGIGPIVLAPPERYLVVLAALCDGQCAIYETTTGVLTPCALGEGRLPEVPG